MSRIAIAPAPTFDEPPAFACGSPVGSLRPTAGVGVSRGVVAADRSPLSEEIKAEVARLDVSACDGRVLAALLPRAVHLGMPARRLARRTEGVPSIVLRRACCRRAYLRGLFLAGGSLSTGASGNCLEILPPRGEVARARAAFVHEGFVARERSRRGRAVLALRDADAIGAFLRAIGATETLLRFEAKRVSREVRARTNALVNADAANLARAVVAAREQSQAIRALVAAGRMRGMPEHLRDAGRARLRAPTATLAELAARLRITKWVARARLRALMEAART